MTICVTNCMDWIGFHLINRLTESDYQVEGISDLSTKKEEEMSFMLGRNSQFSLYQHESELKDKEYTHIILLNSKKPDSVKAIKTYNLGKNLDNPDVINIVVPLLFGEWMPMDEKGIYSDKTYIQFDSDRFQDEAIYIDDFVDCFMQWLPVKDLPRRISLSRNRNLENKKDSLENQLYIRENRPIDRQVVQVIEHYKKIKDL